MKKNINNVNEEIKIPLIIFSITFSLFFLIIMQFSPLYAIATNKTTDSAPVISFQEESYNFGEITPEEIPTHIFKFKNTGDEALIIKGIKVTCESCVDALLISTKIIEPGETGEIKVTINSLDIKGRFSKRIYVNSNDPNNPQIAIKVLGFIKSPFQFYFEKGMSYLGKGEYNKAISEFEKSIELDSDHTESYYYLGQCYLQMGIIEYNKKHILNAYSLYRKANEISEKVIPLYEKTIKDNPEDLNSYLKLGYIYETKSMVPFVNEYDKALEYYLKALNLDIVSESQNTSIYIYLNIRIGIINYQEKDYSKSIEYLEKVKKTFPQNTSSRAYYYLGMSYNKIGEKEKAITSFSRVIEIAPQSEFAREAEKKLKELTN